MGKTAKDLPVMSKRDRAVINAEQVVEMLESADAMLAEARAMLRSSRARMPDEYREKIANRLYCCLESMNAASESFRARP